MGEPYRINPWTAEFAEPACEAAFRADERDVAVRYLRITLLITAFFFSLWGYLDYLDLGPGATFYSIIAARAVIAGSAVTLALALTHKPELVSDGVALSCLLASGFTVFVWTVAVRPDEPQAHGMAMIIMVVGTYLFLPNRLLLSFAVATYACLLFIACLLWIVSPPWGQTIGLILVLLLANCICCLSAYRFSVLRREAYALLRNEEHVVAELKQEAGQRSILEAELKRMATTDDLTALYNRRHFLDLANQELRRVRRNGAPLAVCLLDVDHFKRINDSHGHGCGDKALSKVAEACRGALRESDIIGRFGGEEFTIALPDTDLEQAMQVAERLRECIAELTVPTTDGVLVMTVTIGVTCSLPGDQNIEQALAIADAALYEGKHQGRNRVVRRDREPRLVSS